MSVTIKDIIKIRPFTGYDLLAGKNGLQNRVELVSVYEDTPEPNDDVIPRKNVFYITSLYYQKDNPEKIIDYMKLLRSYSASGVCVFDGFVNEIPKDALDYCDRNGLPVLFVSHNIPYADIISSVMEIIILSQQESLLETKVSALKSGILGDYEIEETLNELNPHFLEYVSALYILPKEQNASSKENIRNLIKSINNGTSNFACNYKRGVLALISYPESAIPRIKKNMEDQIKQIGLFTDSALIGISDSKSTFNCGDAISQALLCVRLLRGVSGAYSNLGYSKKKLETSYYSDLGILRFLVSIANSKHTDTFINEIISPILNHDKKYHTALLDTLNIFMETDCSYVATGSRLFVHENTIRYRIAKIRELLDYHESDTEMFHMLYIALKLYNLRVNS